MSASAVKTVAKKFVDWHLGVKIIGSVKPEIKKSVQDTLNKNGELQRMIQEAKENRPKLNWEAYNAILTSSADNALLQDCIKKMETFQPVKLDVKAMQKAVDDEAVLLSDFAEAHALKLETQISTIQEKLSSLDNMKPVEDLTMAEIFERYPEWKQEVDDALKNEFHAVGMSYYEYKESLKKAEANGHH